MLQLQDVHSKEAHLTILSPKEVALAPWREIIAWCRSSWTQEEVVRSKSEHRLGRVQMMCGQPLRSAEEHGLSGRGTIVARMSIGRRRQPLYVNWPCGWTLWAPLPSPSTKRDCRWPPLGKHRPAAAATVTAEAAVAAFATRHSLFVDDDG